MLSTRIWLRLLAFVEAAAFAANCWLRSDLPVELLPALVGGGAGFLVAWNEARSGLHRRVLASVATFFSVTLGISVLWSVDDGAPVEAGILAVLLAVSVYVFIAAWCRARRRRKRFHDYVTDNVLSRAGSSPKLRVPIED